MKKLHACFTALVLMLCAANTVHADIIFPETNIFDYTLPILLIAALLILIGFLVYRTRKRREEVEDQKK